MEEEIFEPRSREEQYKEKQDALLKKCIRCNESAYKPNHERCDYSCSTGKTLRRLEAEYSDVTGWSHKSWKDTAKAVKQVNKNKGNNTINLAGGE